MKLELRHLAPYLPYGLKCQWFRTEDQTLVTNELNITDYYWLIGRQHFQPILRPMSDFKPGEGASTWAIEVDKMFNYNVYMLSGYSHVKTERYPYVVFNYLIENHFDVFDLIDKGLAIDINTLPNIAPNTH